MIRAVALFAGLLFVGLFALLNWTAFSTPTPLSLGVTTVEAPLGLIMLGAVLFLTVLFTVWAISLQASALLEARRQTKELQAQRELADRAEASRFTELRTTLMAEIGTVLQSQHDTRDLVINRMDRLQEAARANMEESTNTLSAYIGELEDNLENSRVLPRRRESDHEALVTR